MQESITSREDAGNTAYCTSQKYSLQERSETFHSEWSSNDWIKENSGNLASLVFISEQYNRTGIIIVLEKFASHDDK